jgi:phage tail-like protein
MAARASKFDPLRTYKFRVRLGEKAIAGVTKVSALGRNVAATEVKQGGDMLAPRQNPGQVTYDDVTLEWGLCLDRTMEDWSNDIARVHVDPSVKNFKRTVYIDVYDIDGNPADRAGAPVLTYKLNKCWISKYAALPALDAGASGYGIQSVTLRHGGWERIG